MSEPAHRRHRQMAAWFIAAIPCGEQVQSNPMHTTDSRPDARDRYRSVVSTVQHNTGDPQPPFAREATIVLICAGDGQFTPDGVRDALQAAVENDDLLRARRDGPRYAAVDEPSLVQAVQAEAGRDDTDHQFVARCNDHLDQLREAS